VPLHNHILLLLLLLHHLIKVVPVDEIRLLLLEAFISPTTCSRHLHLHMIRVTHYGVVDAKPRVSHLSLLLSFTLYGKTMRRIENRLTHLVTVAVILSIKYLLLLVDLL